MIFCYGDNLMDNILEFIHPFYHREVTNDKNSW